MDTWTETLIRLFNFRGLSLPLCATISQSPLNNWMVLSFFIRGSCQRGSSCLQRSKLSIPSWYFSSNIKAWKDSIYNYAWLRKWVLSIPKLCCRTNQHYWNSFVKVHVFQTGDKQLELFVSTLSCGSYKMWEKDMNFLISTNFHCQLYLIARLLLLVEAHHSRISFSLQH